MHSPGDSISSIRYLLLVLVAAVGMAGCGGGDDDGPTTAAPDPERAARQRLPEHNPNAQYRGKTALEYAQNLSDLAIEVRVEALMNLMEFGVDALPAREQVRQLVDSDPNLFVRMAALGTLANMQAPEAPAVVRQKLMDPNFASEDRSAYVAVVEAAEELDIPEEDLRSDIARLVASDLDHATQLMMLQGLPHGYFEALAKAVFQANHNAQARRFFVSRIDRLTFLGDEPRKAYLRKLATDDPQLAAAALRNEFHDIELYLVLVKAVFESDHTAEARNFFIQNITHLDFLDDDAKKAFLDQLVASDQQRAMQLLNEFRLPIVLQQHMLVTLLNNRDTAQPGRTHGDEQVVWFLIANLSEAHFIDDETKMAFVRDNAVIASQPASRRAVSSALGSVGTVEAMDLALNLGEMSAQQKYALMIEFARTGVDSGVILDRMVSDMNAMTSQQEINLLGGSIVELVMQSDGASDQGRALRQKFITTMGEMMTAGPSDDHRAIASLYLVAYVRQTPDAPVTALEPVFTILGDENAADIVRGTAGTQLLEGVNDLADREGFIERTVQAMWDGKDVNATHFPERILIALGGFRPGRGIEQVAERAKRICVLIADDVDDHLESWSINPAVVVLLNITETRMRLLYETSEKTRASAALGKMLVSPHLHPQYMPSDLGRHFSNLVSLGGNTIDGFIDLYEPVLLAGRDTVVHSALGNRMPVSFHAAHNQRYVLQADAEAQQRWIGFLQRIAAADIGSPSSYAQTALTRLETALNR